MSALFEATSDGTASPPPPATPPTTAEQHFPPWDLLLDEARRRSERRAWWVAALAVTLAFSAVIGLSVAVNYRRVVPYLLAMDRATGNVEYIGAIDDRTLKGYQDILDKHWVETYVRARAAYFYPLLQQDYDTVLDMSSAEVAQEYENDREGAFARQERYGKQVEIRPTISSTQLFSNPSGQFATVRFSTVTRRLDNSSSGAAEFFIVTLRYRYQPATFGKERELIRNPLGFKTESYRVSAELATLPAPDANSRPERG